MDKLYSIFIAMYHACLEKDGLGYNRHLKFFNGLYRKATDEEEGEFHARVAEFMKGAGYDG